MIKQAHRLLWIFGTLISSVGCDQATKVFARQNLGTHPVSYFGDLIRLQHSENSGAFMSMGAEFPSSLRFLIFTLAIAVLLTGALWFLLRSKTHSLATTLGLTLVIAGGIGNLIDRAWKGSVTDFLNFGIGWLRTGIFNIADVCIVSGVFILCWLSFVNRDNKNTKMEPR